MTLPNTPPSTTDHPPSNSPPSDEDINLTGTIRNVEGLSTTERSAMRSLMNEYYENVSPEQFKTDLDEKEKVILLRDDETRIRGFSTMKRFSVTVDGQEVVGIFSGDTIIEPVCWGTFALLKSWLTLALQWSDDTPHDRVYWLLLSAGYKTYRFLPVFFDAFYPTHETPTPPKQQRILDTLATARYPETYDPDDGVVRLNHPTPLRDGVAPPTERRRQDPNVSFFLESNPGHTEGDELVCLTQVTRANLGRAAHRML